MNKRIKLMSKYFKKNVGKPNQEVAVFMDADVENALGRAKKLMGDAKVSEPIVIRTIDLENPEAKFRLSQPKKSEDFVVEYNNTLLTALFLGEKEINYYQARIDHITGRVYGDVLGEIKYADVSNTELNIINEVRGKNERISKVTFDMHLGGAGTLSLILRNHYMFNEQKYPNVLTEKEQYIVNTLRAAINTK